MAQILFVEDDDQVRVLVEDVLRDAGYKVDATANMTGARSLLASNTYDLMLADARLPDGTGFTIAREATEKDIKVLVYTAYGPQFPTEERALYPVIAKPVRVSDLLMTIKHFLGERIY